MTSTISETAARRQSLPTGTWQADTVHSSVAFEVPYAVATFSGEVTDFDASTRRRQARRARRASRASD